MKCTVTVSRLNKRSAIPQVLTDKSGIIGAVTRGFEFVGSEVPTTNGTEKWYKDLQGYYYWGGGLLVTSIPVPQQINGTTKEKVLKVVNVFETGSPDGDYAKLVTLKDYTNPKTKAKEFQITYGRSQTTEFSHLHTLIQDYVAKNGAEAESFDKYLGLIGKQPSLRNDAAFKEALKRAGKDPIMKNCQDSLFENEYYQPAYRWFDRNGFTLPLSLLVVYDSRIHSGGMLPFLQNKINSKLPVYGGNEHDWIAEYVAARYKWLSNHSNKILQNTIYRMQCFTEQIHVQNWDLTKPIKTQGRIIT